MVSSPYGLWTCGVKKGQPTKCFVEDATNSRRDGTCPVSLRGGRCGKPRLYAGDCCLVLASFSRIMVANCETLPAPSVRTMSPGCAPAATAATASEKEGAYATLSIPAAARPPAGTSPLMPSMGLSLAG